MQVKRVNAHVSTSQDAFPGSQSAPICLVVGDSHLLARPILIGFSFKKIRPIHRDVLRGIFRNEHDSYKFRRHRYRRFTHG
jgi:hypothetical protein